MPNVKKIDTDWIENPSILVVDKTNSDSVLRTVLVITMDDSKTKVVVVPLNVLVKRSVPTVRVYSYLSHYVIDLDFVMVKV